MPIESMPLKTNSLWIMSKKLDLLWIFGGALASLFVLALLLIFPISLLWIYWIWIIIFDNTHLWSTYSRTYFDKKFVKENKSLIWGSLIFFLIPIIFSFYYALNPNKKLMDIFLFLAQTWAIYHVVRQHYGYLSLYDRKNKTSDANHQINKYFLFSLIGGSYLHFLIFHPFNRKVAGILPIEENSITQKFEVILKCFLIVAFLLYGIRSYIKRKDISLQTILFNSVCIFLYGSIFLYFAYLEPFFTLATSPLHFFMGIGIMISIFHDLQYHGLVWYHNKNKYSQASETFGLATTLNRNFASYCFFAIIFSLFYGVFLWFTGEYPWLNGKAHQSGFIPIAFGVWWGFLFHHYYLDQKIWRIKKSPDLQKSFSIANKE